MRVYIYKVSILFAALVMSVMAAMAQDDVEYRMEIGAGLGLTAYQGDFSSSITKNMQPTGAVIFRRVLNPRSAVRFSGMYTRLKGDMRNIDTVYPDLVNEGYSFSNALVDVSATYEYNFMPYGTGHEYRGAKRLVPFLSLGLGITYANCSGGTWDYASLTNPHSMTKGTVAANLPLGFGMKYRIGDRTNLSVDWQMHFSMSDQLDGVQDPYRLKSDGLFKNTDCYSTLTVGLTYSFSAKCPTCMKDR